MISKSKRLVLVSLTSILLLTSFAVNAAEGPNPRAKKYLTLLNRHPANNYLFDRFYDAWLDTDSVEGLQTYLNDQSNQHPEQSYRLLLGFFYLRQGQNTEAIEAMQAVLEHDPNQPAVWYEKAQAEARLLNLDEAITDLTTVLDKEPEASLREKATKLLGQYYSRNQEKEKALETWKQLLNENPKDETLLEDLIELHLNEGLYEEAIGLCDQLLSLTKDNYQYVIRSLRKGDVYQYQNQIDKAIDIYCQTLEKVGLNTWLEKEIFSQIEQVYRRRDDLTGLEGVWERLIKQYPQRISLKIRQAALLVHTNQIDKALAMYDNLLAITPGDLAIQKAYIEALIRAQKLPQAIAVLNHLTEQHPDQIDLLIQLADLHYRHKALTEASNALTQYLAKSNQTENDYNRVARLLERYGLNDQAEEVYAQCLKAYPDSRAAQESMAAFDYRIGRKDQALERWQRLAKDKKTNLSSVLHITQALRTRRHNEEALAILEARYEDFKDSTDYLNRLCQVAILQKAYDKALPWAQKQVAISQVFDQVQRAIKQTLDIVQNTSSEQELITTLEAMDNRSAQQDCLLAELFERIGDPCEADRVLATGRDAQGLLKRQQQVRLCRLRHDWVQAAAYTQKLMETPGSKKSRHLRELIDLYQRSFQYQQALDLIPVWKRTVPGSSTPWLTEAKLWELLQKTEEALTTLRQAATALPDNTDILLALAQLQQRNQHYADAERIYWRLYEHAKDIQTKLRWVQDLGQCCAQAGRQNVLIEKLIERQQTNRTDVTPYLALAEIYRQANRYEERRQALMEATRLKPKDISLLQEIARIEEDEGQWQDAILTLQKAAALDKTNQTRHKIARLHLLYGDPQEGYRTLLDIAGGNQMDPRDAESTASSMILGSHWDLAISFLKDMVNLHPMDYRLGMLYGIALEENGQQQEALDVFIRLLGHQTEIPGFPQPAPTNPSHTPPYVSSQQSYQAIMPAQARELMTFSQIFGIAYQHRQSMGGVSRYYYSRYQSRSNQSAIALPKQISDLVPYALSHIVTLAQWLDEDEQAQIQTAMEAQGCSQAGIYLALSGPPHDPFGNNMDELVEKYPDNDALLALWIIRNPYIDEDKQAWVLRTLKRFEKPYPVLCLQLGLRAWGQGMAEARPICKRLIEKQDPPELIAATFLRQALVQPQLRGSFTEEDRLWLTNKCIDWWEKLKNNPALPPNQDEQYHLILLSQLADYHYLFDWINQKLQSPPTLASQQTPQHDISNLWYQMRETLPFPPQTLPGLPESIVSFLSGSFFSKNYPAAQTLLESTTPVKNIMGLNDPCLRSLLLLSLGEYNLARIQLQQHLAKEKTNTAVNILYAGFEVQDGNELNALKLLETTRDLTEDPQDQEMINLSILSLSQSFGMDPNDPAFISGQKAALALAKRPLQTFQREQLARIMINLGLEKEAKRLQRAPAQTRLSTPAYAASQPGQFIGSSFSLGRYAPNRTDQIIHFIQLGQQDKAVKALYDTLKQHILQQTSSPNPPYYYSSSQNRQISELITLIHTNTLVEPLLAKAHPQTSQSIRQLLLYARLCELLGQPTKAIAAYQRILEQQKRHQQASLHLAMILAPNDVNAASDILAALPPHLYEKIGTELAQHTERASQYKADECLAYANLALAYMDKVPPPKSFNSNHGWAMQIAQYLNQGQRIQNVYLPSLTSKPSPNLSKSDRDLLHQRRVLHQKICQQLLNIPSQAQGAFTQLYRASQTESSVEYDLTAAARTVLFTQNPNSTPSAVYPYIQFSTVYNNEVIPSPLEYLVSQAWQDNTLETLEASLTEHFTNINQHQQIQYLQELTTLYTCDPNQFLEKAQTYARSNRYPGNRYQRRMNTPSLQYVINIYQERKLKIDLSPLFLTNLQSSLYQNNPNQLDQALLQYLRYCLDENPTLGENLLQQVTERFLGPKEQRYALVKKYYRPDRYGRVQNQANNYTKRISRQVNLITQLAADPDHMFMALQCIEGLPPLKTDLRHRVDNIIRQTISQSRNGESIEALLSFLDQSPFIGSAHTFTPIPMLDLEKGSVYANLFQTLKQYINGRRLETFTTQLTEAWPEAELTFGKQLFLSLMSDTPDKTTYEFLGTQLDTLKQIDAIRQQELVNALVSILGTIPPARVERWANPGKAAFEWANQFEGHAAQDRVKEFLATANYTTLGVEYHSLDDYVTNLLGPLPMTDPNLAVDILNKTTQLIEKARKLNQWRSSDGPGQVIGNIIYRLDETVRARGGVELMVRLIRNPQSSLCLDTNRFDSISRAIRAEYEQLYRQSKDKLQALEHVYLILDKQSQGGNLAAFARVYDELFQYTRWNEDEIRGAAAWIDLKVKDPNALSVAREMQLFIQNKLADYLPSKEREAARKTARQNLWDYYHKIAEQDTDSIPWRLLSLNNLRYRLSDMPEANQTQSLQLIRQAWSQQRLISPDYYQGFLDTFQSQEQTPEWTQQASELADAFEHFADKLRKLNQVSNSRSYQYRQITLNMIKLNLALERYNQAERLIQVVDPQQASNIITWALFIEANQKQTFQKMINTHWQQNYRSGNYRPSEKLEKHLDHCLEGLTDDLAYIARIKLISLNNSNSPSKPIDPNDPRIELYKKFAHINFRNDKIRRNTLALLCENKALLPYIEAPLKDEVKHLNVSLIVAQQDHTQKQLNQKLLFAYYETRLLAGDPNAYITGIEHAILAKTNSHSQNSYHYDQIRRELYRLPGQLGERIKRTWTPLQMHALAEASRSPFEKDKSMTSGYLYDIARNGVIFHALTNQIDTWNTVIDTIPKQRQEQVKNYTRFDQLRRDLSDYLRDNPNIDLNQKLEIYAQVAPPTDNIETKTIDATIEAILNSGLMDRRELLKDAQALVKLIDDKPLAWEEVAQQQQRYGLRDEAIQSWLKAIKLSTDEYDRWSRQVDYIGYLMDNRKYDLARDYVKTLDTSEWPDRLRKTLTKYKERLERTSPSRTTPITPSPTRSRSSRSRRPIQPQTPPRPTPSVGRGR